MVIAHDAINGIETETGAFSHFFGREERLKDVRFNVFGNSRTVVDHLNQNRIEFPVGANREDARLNHLWASMQLSVSSRWLEQSTPRLNCAAASPRSAAFRYQRIASVQSRVRPRPLSYMRPRLNWAAILPC